MAPYLDAKALSGAERLGLPKDPDDRVTRTAPSGRQLAGFHGRSGDEVDKTGFIHTKR